MMTSDMSDLSDFCARDVFGTRIEALHKAYEDIGGAQFMTQRGESGCIISAVSNVGGAATLCCSKESVFDELAAYLNFADAITVLCGGDYGKRFCLKETSSGSVVQAPITEHTEPFFTTASPFQIVSSADEIFSYKGIYDTLLSCGFSVGGFTGWRADIALRIRRSTAETLAIHDGGTVAATASALFNTNSATLLGAVGTLPQFRGRGYAGALVRTLAQKYTVQGKRVELLCEAHRLSFYESLGFCETGRWFAGAAE